MAHDRLICAASVNVAFMPFARLTNIATDTRYPVPRRIPRPRLHGRLTANLAEWRFKTTYVLREVVAEFRRLDTSLLDRRIQSSQNPCKLVAARH
jgi:hypothetical protein